MKKQANQLMPGDVVSSGETVVRVYEFRGRVFLILVKDGKERRASWRADTTISVYRD